MQDLGTLPGSSGGSEGVAINASGHIVGVAENAANVTVPFLWDGNAMTDLNSILVNGVGWTLFNAAGINDSGQITGSGLINGKQHAFLLTPVAASATPEPSAWLLAGLGFGLIALRTRGA